MKLQIISINNRSSVSAHSHGFLTVEVMIAFSLLIVFSISIISLRFSADASRIISIKLLEKLQSAVNASDKLIDSNYIETHNANIGDYGNFSKKYDINPFSILYTDYTGAWGRENCDMSIDINKFDWSYEIIDLDFGGGNKATDFEIRNGVAYIVADSAKASDQDFYIFDTKNSGQLISSLNTGPGITSIEVVGTNVFLAQASTQNQLQIIDIKNRKDPILISQLKLPPPFPTSTLPFSRSIFYSQGYIYLGTEKWNGAEFLVIDVSDIYNPKVIGSLETDTLIKDIYIRGSIAFLASSDEKQLRVVDISNMTEPKLIEGFSPSGWQTQEGNTIDFFENTLLFGRTVGGFNNVKNHELFIFASSTISSFSSMDIPGGVYKIIFRKPFIYIITHKDGEEFQIFNDELKRTKSFNLEIMPVSMRCDLNNLYFLGNDLEGPKIIKIKNE